MMEKDRRGLTMDHFHAMARGKGRQLNPLDLLAMPEPVCEQIVPPELAEAYVEGIGAGLRCRLLWGPPDRMVDKICPTFIMI